MDALVGMVGTVAGIFTLGTPLWQIAVRAVVVYAAVLLGFRIFGKREVGQMELSDLVLLIQLILVAGLSLIVSMANLFFRDVKYLMTFVLQLWFFATNVMYPIKFEQHPALNWVSRANPMIAILNAYRDCLMGEELHDPVGLAVAAGVAVVVLLGGWRVFHQAEFKFAEYV